MPLLTRSRGSSAQVVKKFEIRNSSMDIMEGCKWEIHAILVCLYRKPLS